MEASVGSARASFGDVVHDPIIRYFAVLLVGAVAVAVALVEAGYEIGNIPSVAALALVAAVSDRASVRLSATAESSISLLPTLFAAVLFGPLAAMIVHGSSLLGDLRRPYMRCAVYA